MSARRAVLLTLVVVVLIAILGVAGFLAYRGYNGYQDAQDRAKKAEARAKRAERRARGDYSTGYEKGSLEGMKTALFISGLDTPGWYVVRVATGGTPGVQPVDVNLETKMGPCKTYWFDPSDDTVWSRSENNC